MSNQDEGRRLTMIRRLWLYCILLSSRDYSLSALLSFLFLFVLVILYGAPAMSLT